MNWNVKVTKWFWILLIAAAIVVGLAWARSAGIITI